MKTIGAWQVGETRAGLARALARNAQGEYVLAVQTERGGRFSLMAFTCPPDVFARALANGGEIVETDYAAVTWLAAIDVPEGLGAALK